MLYKKVPKFFMVKSLKKIYVFLGATTQLQYYCVNIIKFQILSVKKLKHL